MVCILVYFQLVFPIILYEDSKIRIANLEEIM